MKPFVHLHLHTEYSLLDGFARIERLFDRCSELGMPAVAITDHGAMFGVVDFYKAAKKKGIQPIIGCEVYVAPRSRLDRNGSMDKSGYHLVLLAKNETGYQNLIRLVSMGYLEGFYYRPRIDDEILAEHSEGLIALSACLAGEIQVLLLENRYEEAKTKALYYNGLFGQNHFYLELQDHYLEEQKAVNPLLVRLSRDTGIPLVATNDVHYLEQNDHEAHDILLCIQTGKTVSDGDRMTFSTREFYMKSGDQMAELFPYAPEAIENTVKIAEMCQFDFEFGQHHLPRFPIAPGQSAEAYLRELCEQGIKGRFGVATDELRERLNFELDVIIKMGYEDYFLIVWDFIKFAKDRGILVGPGRGSCGGSLVAYVLRITDVDPIRYGLIFERFLNPERITMPDIDIDFQDDRRQEVIDYVIEKYGKDHVAQIITFGTMGARAAIRDVGRVLDMPYGDVDRVAKLIPFSPGMTIDRGLELSKDLKTLYETEPNTRKLITVAKSLEGVPRHASTHAAGVVIARKPVDSYVPLYVQDGNLSTQFNMTLLEELGLLKMDFLGLRTLTVLKESLDLIRETRGVEIVLEQLPLDDKAAYDLISSGDTLGIFQLESSGMRRFMKDLKPSCLEDIIAGISLYRPGPMDSIQTYIYNKNHQDEVEFLHPSLEPILKVTYGCLVYQEQVMQVVRELAGYSYGRSDLVRRVMSKKKMDVMQKERQAFIYGIESEDGTVELEGCLRRGVPESVANTIFDDMVDFANYAFNKSHAAAYALIAYQTAWLKAHYPVEFMAALMTSVMGNHPKIAQYIQDCRSLGIPVMPPDVNHSLGKFTVEGKTIRYGMLGIKNVGDGIVQAIVNGRRREPFKSLSHLCEVIDSRELNKRALESLIKAGALDALGMFRSQMLAVYESLVDGIHQDRRRNVEGQVSLFSQSEFGIDTPTDKSTYPDLEEFPQNYILNFEKEMLGIYLSGHPLGDFQDRLDQLNDVSLAELKEVVLTDASPYQDGDPFLLGGVIVRKTEKVARNGSMMAFVTVEDLTDSLEVVVFPKIYERSNHLLRADMRILVSGKLNFREEEEPKLLADSIQELTEESLTRAMDTRGKRRSGWRGGSVKKQAAGAAEGKRLFVRMDMWNETSIGKLKGIIQAYPGKTDVICYITADGSRRKAPETLRVAVTDQLITRLEEAYGKGSVKYV